jgi:hypothetical protein
LEEKFMLTRDQEQEVGESIELAPLVPPARLTAARPQTGTGNPLLSRLLKIAEGYCKEKAIRQAVEIYFEMVETQSHTPEALVAREELLRIGEQYERNGEFRQARSLYERLL